MKKIDVKFMKMYPNVKLPVYKTPFASGCDIYAYTELLIRFEAFETKLIPTGLRVSIPEGYEIQVRPRSGMSLKTNFRIANQPGTVDSDYRGEIGIILQNVYSYSCELPAGERIAQLVLCPVFQINFIEDELDFTVRGEGGFGSTGVK